MVSPNIVIWLLWLGCPGPDDDVILTLMGLLLETQQSPTTVLCLLCSGEYDDLDLFLIRVPLQTQSIEVFEATVDDYAYVLM